MNSSCGHRLGDLGQAVGCDAVGCLACPPHGSPLQYQVGAARANFDAQRRKICHHHTGIMLTPGGAPTRQPATAPC